MVVIAFLNSYQVLFYKTSHLCIAYVPVYAQNIEKEILGLCEPLYDQGMTLILRLKEIMVLNF